MNSASLVCENKLTEKQKVILYFFIYALLGWILETVFCLITLGTFSKRGFLYGPLCPMYGFAAIGMIQLLKNIKTNTIGKFFIYFFFVFLIWIFLFYYVFSS